MGFRVPEEIVDPKINDRLVDDKSNYRKVDIMFVKPKLIEPYCSWG
jgi:hypothetical protein